MNQMKNSILLLLTAVIWGVAFVAQSVGMEYIGPYTFLCVRSVIGGLILIPIIPLLKKWNGEEKKQKNLEERRRGKKDLLMGGVVCGTLLCFASCFQQIGILYTSVGKAGFLTALYIVIVPLIGLFFKKKCSCFVWIGVVFALFGLYFLCITENLKIEKGDILVFICAILFSIHILVIDYFASLADGIKMSCIQFFVCGAISGAAMLLWEMPRFDQILLAWKPVLYAGVLSSGVGYTLQIVGQRGMNPTIASLILSLESVTSVLAGLVLLNEQLNGREMMGCIFMFTAILFAQIPEKKELFFLLKRKEKRERFL